MLDVGDRLKGAWADMDEEVVERKDDEDAIQTVRSCVNNSCH